MLVEVLLGWMGSSGGLEGVLAGVVLRTGRSAALEFVADVDQG